jgi:hypothetical protein
MADVHEFTSFRFKPEFDREEQFRSMEELAPLMVSQDGLLRRSWHYSERDDSWMSHLVWTDEAAIDAAGPRLETDLRAVAIFDRFDLDSMHYSRYELIGSVDRDDLPPQG